MLACTKCKENKSDNEFDKVKSYPNRGFRHVWCKPCRKTYHKTYSAKWEQQNKEKRKLRYKTEHYKTVRREWSRKYYQENKSYWQDWYQENKPTARAKMDEWRANNLDTWNGYGRKRRAMIKGRSTVPYKGLEIYERDKGFCGICKLPIDIKLKFPDVNSFSVDHILPIAIGGDDTPDNVQAAHLGCNARKAHRG